MVYSPRNFILGRSFETDRMRTTTVVGTFNGNFLEPVIGALQSDVCCLIDITPHV